MRARDVLALALAALRGDSRRAWLSLLGVAIGIASVLLLSAIGEGARGFVEQQFAGLGSNILAVVPGKVKTGGLPGLGNTTADLTLEDALALRRGLPRALHVAPLCLGTESVSCGARARDALVLATSAQMLPIRGLELAAGSFLPDGDWRAGARVIALGARLASELFPLGDALGAQVRVGDWRMRVIGVLRARGVHFGADLDDAAYIPIATGLELFDRRSLFRVLLMLRSPHDVAPAEAAAAALLRERHGREDVTLLTPDAVLGSLGSILRAMTLALIGIAAISLCVAGIGVANVMLVAVAQRRSEVGLWMALGATRAQVLALFLAEAALLSSAGGLLGLSLGTGLSLACRALVPAFPAAVPAWSALAALALAAFVGLVAGAWPARRAARLDPIVALSRR